MTTKIKDDDINDDRDELLTCNHAAIQIRFMQTMLKNRFDAMQISFSFIVE